MPWKQTIPMEQKIEFICAWRTGKYTITDLCNAFGISRPTAYKRIARFEQSGFDGLRDHSRTPRNHPNQTSENIIESILGLKKKYPRWGAKKLRVLLFNELPNEDIPYVVTVHNILKKNGFVSTKKRCAGSSLYFSFSTLKNVMRYGAPTTKEKFLMGNNIYCHPLTIADSKIRFLFSAKGHYKETLKVA